MKEKDVRIAVYDTGRGKQAIIKFYEGADGFFEDGYVRLWGKGHRLYFLRSNKDNKAATFKILSNHQLVIARQDICEELMKYEGEYLLQFDRTSGRYIDRCMKMDAEFNKGLQTGIERNQPKREIVDKNTPKRNATGIEHEPAATVEEVITPKEEKVEMVEERSKTGNGKDFKKQIVELMKEYAKKLIDEDQYDKIVSLGVIIKEVEEL